MLESNCMGAPGLPVVETWDSASEQASAAAQLVAVAFTHLS